MRFFSLAQSVEQRIKFNADIHVYTRIYTRIYKTTKVSNVVNVLLYKNIVQKVIVTDKSDSQSASSVVPL